MMPRHYVLIIVAVLAGYVLRGFFPQLAKAVNLPG